MCDWNNNPLDFVESCKLDVRYSLKCLFQAKSACSDQELIGAKMLLNFKMSIRVGSYDIQIKTSPSPLSFFCGHFVGAWFQDQLCTRMAQKRPKTSIAN